MHVDFSFWFLFSLHSVLSPALLPLCPAHPPRKPMYIYIYSCSSSHFFFAASTRTQTQTHPTPPTPAPGPLLLLLLLLLLLSRVDHRLPPGRLSRPCTLAATRGGGGSGCLAPSSSSSFLCVFCLRFHFSLLLWLQLLLRCVFSSWGLFFSRRGGLAPTPAFRSGSRRPTKERIRKLLFDHALSSALGSW